MKNINKLVPDTSIIIENLVSKKIDSNELSVKEIIIHEAVLSELEHQANVGKEIGHLGLEEIKKLQILSKTKKFVLSFSGKRPDASQIRHASLGEVDALIRDLAFELKATLMTGDKVQSKVAEAKGMDVIYIEPLIQRKQLTIEKYFDETTMSLHIRENTIPYAKRGMPGNWQVVQVETEQTLPGIVEEIAKEVVEAAKSSKNGFIESERRGSTIIQLDNYRILITRPPFSDAWEITAVKPIRKTTLEDYNLSEKLMKRIKVQAEGILIAGSPGHGKCLDGNEIIYTDDLMQVTASEMYNSNKRKILSINKDGKVKPCNIINKAKRTEKRGIYSVSTISGRTIKVTPEHPLLVFDGKEIKWKSAKDLTHKDKISVIKNLEIKTDDNLDLIHNYNPETTLCSFNSIKLDLPIYMKYFGMKREILKLLCEKNTMKKSELLNSFSRDQISKIIKPIMGEGVLCRTSRGIYNLRIKSFNTKDHNCLLLKDYLALNLPLNKITHIARTHNNLRTNFISLPNKATPELCRFLGYMYSEGSGENLSFTNSNKSLVDDFKNCFAKTFGDSKWKNYGISHVSSFKYAIEPIIRKFGIPDRKKSKMMSLPNFLFKCSENNLSSFLGAYFDGDGGVDKNNVIEFYTSSSICSQQLSILLLRLGIFSHANVKFTKGWNRYTVRIVYLDSIKKFHSLIKIKSLDKTHKIEKALQKKYTQMHSYDMGIFLDEINIFIKINKKNNISLERLNELLELMYKTYYLISSKGENYLIILKEYIENLGYMKKLFDNDKDKLTCSILRMNHMDHNYVDHWENNRKIKISSLNKICSILGYNISVKPKNISYIINSCAGILKFPIVQLAGAVQTNGGAFQLRLNRQGDTSTGELIDVHCALSNRLFEVKKLFEEKIKILELMCRSDLFFDGVKEIQNKPGEYEVYDFETENHNFICGKLPLVVHNSTFAAALADFYASQGKTVKTIESPRDLQVSENVTQYSIHHASTQEIRDVLLLSRPDYTLFDEMRNLEDFKLFADLRLSGIGLAGVVHATKAVDAIQRFIGKMELGVIPQVIDTVLFIKSGKVQKVLSLKMVVKVPTGMTEEDLSRPIVEIRDFESDKLEYEIYSYGEETVVVPVDETKAKNPMLELASRQIEKEFSNIATEIKAEITGNRTVNIYVPEDEIARVIGKDGETIKKLEKKIGLNINVESLKFEEDKREIKFNNGENKKYVCFFVDPQFRGRTADIHVDDVYLFSSIIGKNGDINVNKKSKLGANLMKVINAKRKIRMFI